MMQLFGPLVYLACLLITGYGVSAILSNLSQLERFGFAAALGPGVMGLCLIAISMMGLRPSAAVILGIATIFALPAFLQWQRACPQPPLTSPQIPRVWRNFLLLAIGYAIFAVGYDALCQPTVEWDAFAIWQLKAKVLASEPLHPRPAYFTNLNLSYSHLRYPILIPMISAGVHAMSGALANDCEKFPALLLFMGLTAMVYSALRQRCSAAAALAPTALFVNTPMMLKFAGSGTAEIGMVAFWGGSLIAILRWQQSRKLSDVILLGLFSICLAWTKNEGSVLAATNVLAVLLITRKPLARENLRAALGLAIGLAVFFGPWLLYIHPLPRTDEDYASHFNRQTLFAQKGRIPDILLGFGREVIQLKHWGSFWILPPVLAVISWRKLRSQTILTLTVLLLLHLSCYMAAYWVTPDNIAYLFTTTAYRLLLNASPAAALLIGFLWPQRPPENPQKSVPISVLTGG